MLRIGLVVGILAATTPAFADDDEIVKQFADEIVGHHLDRAARLLAPKVALDGLWFDGDCKRFGKPQPLADKDRDTFVGCLQAIAPSSTTRHHGVSTGTILLRDGIAVGITVRDRRITAFGFVDRDPADAAIPTVFRVADRIAGQLAVPDAVRAAVDATRAHRVTATFKPCLDVRGHITKTRAITGSGIAEFDAAARHVIDTYRFEPVELAGHPTAVCEVIRFELDTRPSAAPPDATRPISVAPTALEPLRVKGSLSIAPDVATRRAIGKNHVTGVWKACFDATGVFVSAQSLRSTGYARYDATIESALADWAFKPYEVNGSRSPVCTVATISCCN